MRPNELVAIMLKHPIRYKCWSERIILAGFMLVVSFGRLGLYTNRSGTLVPEWFYGVLLLVSGLTLIWTRGCKAYTRSGRLVAAISMAALAGFAVDIAIKAGTLLNTSSLNLLWFAIVALIEVISRYDCD